MPDTNDTLSTAVSEETPAETTQAEGVEQQQTQTAELLAGKFKTAQDLEKAYKELEKKLGARNPNEVALKLTAEQKTETPTTAQVTTKQEAIQAAQSIGGNTMADNLKALAAQVGWEQATVIMSQVAAQEAVKNALAPLQEQLQTNQLTQNQERYVSAVDKLLIDYPDLEAHAEDINKFLAARPQLRAAIDAERTIDGKKEYLEMAYLRVTAGKAKNTAAAAKTAGTVEAKRQEEMKAATVTAGSGGHGAKTETTNAADEWFKQMESMDKGKKLFG